MFCWFEITREELFNDTVFKGWNVVNNSGNIEDMTYMYYLIFYRCNVDCKAGLLNCMLLNDKSGS